MTFTTFMCVANTKFFGIDCRAVADKYVGTYWHPMTITVHKILVHGQEIIDSNALPVGMLSEQAPESRNKFWRRDREHHTRKMDRKKTMTDLFHRALESSDPAISMIWLHRRQRFSKRLPLPAAVRDLLKPDIGNESTTDNDEEDPNEEECIIGGDDENSIVLTNETDLF